MTTRPSEMRAFQNAKSLTSALSLPALCVVPVCLRGVSFAVPLTHFIMIVVPPSCSRPQCIGCPPPSQWQCSACTVQQSVSRTHCEYVHPIAPFFLSFPFCLLVCLVMFDCDLLVVCVAMPNSWHAECAIEPATTRTNSFLPRTLTASCPMFSPSLEVARARTKWKLLAFARHTPLRGFRHFRWVDGWVVWLTTRIVVGRCDVKQQTALCMCGGVGVLWRDMVSRSWCGLPSGEWCGAR